MKSTLKTSFASRSIATVLLVLASMALWTACTEDSGMLKPGDEAASASSNSTSNWGDYNYNVQVSGRTWTYTITKRTSRSKDMSHFIIDLQNCGDQSATFANIVSATLNGQPANLSPNEGKGTGCDPYALTDNFVKINFPKVAAPYVLVITFDRNFLPFASANAWQKAGTSCNRGTITAPGCPEGEVCSYSQGYFFAGGAENNGASEFWTNGLTIGGFTYTQAEGNSLWFTDRGRGGDQTLNAFFQLGAVRLSGAEGEAAADAALIDQYFSLVGNSITKNCGSFNCSAPSTCYGMVTLQDCNAQNRPTGNPYTYVNLPASVTYNAGTVEAPVSVTITKAQVQAAGSRIGAFIDANHCP
jgi:hypothetical protein